MNERTVLIAVTLVGMAICSFGIGKVAASGGWLTLPGILGCTLGVGILAVVGARLMGRPIGFVESDLMAVALIVALGVVKFGVAAVFRLA